MRLAYSVLQAEAVQRLPASCLPLWPMQMTHGEAIATCFYLLSPARYSPTFLETNHTIFVDSETR
jgi:hypothetical protein